MATRLATKVVQAKTMMESDHEINVGLGILSWGRSESAKLASRRVPHCSSLGSETFFNGATFDLETSKLVQTVKQISCTVPANT